jgi:DNA-binding LacI/PurR family transcriptional regulator
MTVSDIAKLAKVSTATVSRTINRLPTVDPVLARRVWKVIEQVGYFPNTHARTLVSGHSRTLGLMVSDTIICFFPDMVQRFADLCLENDYETLLSPLPRDWQRLDLAARRLIERRVNGVVILTFKQQTSLVEAFSRNRVPFFALELGSEGPPSKTIRIDYEHGIRQAVQYLAALGHTRIGFISGPANLNSAIERKTAFENCMKEIDLDVSRVLFVEGDNTMEGGMKAMSTLASLPNPPSAVVCSNDLTAMGLMREALLRGFNIPGNLSVIGIDDTTVARLMTPSLTTVHISQVEIAAAAFRALHYAAEEFGEKSVVNQYIVATKLVIRGSTAIAPGRLSARVESQQFSPTTNDVRMQ